MLLVGHVYGLLCLVFKICRLLKFVTLITLICGRYVWIRTKLGTVMTIQILIGATRFLAVN